MVSIGECVNLELELLRRYLNDHDELPPLNHAAKRLLRKVLTESIQIKRVDLILILKKEIKS